MENQLTVEHLVIGRLHELQGLHESFGGRVFWEMGQSLLESALNKGVDGIPVSIFEYFEMENM